MLLCAVRSSEENNQQASSPGHSIEHVVSAAKGVVEHTNQGKSGTSSEFLAMDSPSSNSGLNTLANLGARFQKAQERIFFFANWAFFFLAQHEQVWSGLSV